MKRILVIDDDDQFREMLRFMLEREGYEVNEGFDGEIGLNLQKEKPFDLAITDIIMPNKEGIGTIVDLRANYPDLKIIAISGGGRIVPNDYLKIAERLGAHGTLSKPFKRKELVLIVKDVLD